MRPFYEQFKPIVIEEPKNNQKPIQWIILFISPYDQVGNLQIQLIVSDFLEYCEYNVIAMFSVECAVCTVLIGEWIVCGTYVGI